uniref:Uncharacterized protein n=1 Tax=Globisporangium ultimum (strain ATCC 200006 / CBS 805.95 / DAOM BR144) TaxID=431595 RepID=K3X9T2_GLOUD
MPQDRRKIRNRGTKLPKMNNSERGKYYRQKYKEYEDGLMESVTSLKQQIRSIEMLHLIQHELFSQYPTLQNSGRMISQVAQYVVRAQDGDFSCDTGNSQLNTINFPVLEQFFNRSARAESANGEFTSGQRMPSLPAFRSEMNNTASSRSRWEQFWMRHTCLQFELLSFQIWGDDNCHGEAPVISLQGLVHTRYTMQAIVNLFPHIVLDKELVDRLINRDVSYQCTFQFYFHSDGKLQQHKLEASVIEGLYAALGNLESVHCVLNRNDQTTTKSEPQEELLRPRDKARDATEARMALGFILS